MTYGGFRRQLGDLDTDEKPVVACLINLLICYFCLVRQPSSSCLVSFPLPYARTLKGGEPPGDGRVFAPERPKTKLPYRVIDTHALLPMSVRRR